MIVFIHIPKTAGTTFNRVMKSIYKGNYFKAHAPQNDILNSRLQKSEPIAIKLPGGYVSGPDQFDFIFNLPPDQVRNIEYIGGHIGYVGRSYKGNELQHFTIVRSPLKRLISDYKEHCKPGRRLYKDLKDNNFSFEKYLQLLLEYGMDNIMTRQLSGPYDAIRNPKESLSETDVKLALENSSDILIAETESFDAGLYHLSQKFNWPKVRFKSANVSTGSSGPAVDLSQYSDLVHEVTKFDIQLYDQLKPNIMNSPASLIQKIKWQLSSLKNH